MSTDPSWPIEAPDTVVDRRAGTASGASTPRSLRLHPDEPYVDWVAEITFTRHDETLRRELPLRIYGLLAGEQEMAQLRARDRRWLADHGIAADSVTGVRAWMSSRRDRTSMRDER